jgi:hypothetical protein
LDGWWGRQGMMIRAANLFSWVSRSIWEHLHSGHNIYLKYDHSKAQCKVPESMDDHFSEKNKGVSKEERKKERKKARMKER